MHMGHLPGSDDQGHQGQVRAAQVAIDQDADVVGGDLGRDAGLQASGAMRTWELEPEAVNECGEGRFDGLPQTGKPDARAVALPDRRRQHVGGVVEPVLLPIVAGIAQIGQQWCATHQNGTPFR